MDYQSIEKKHDQTDEGYGHKHPSSHVPIDRELEVFFLSPQTPTPALGMTAK